MLVVSELLREKSGQDHEYPDHYSQLPTMRSECGRIHPINITKQLRLRLGLRVWWSRFASGGEAGANQLRVGIRQRLELKCRSRAVLTVSSIYYLP